MLMVLLSAQSSLDFGNDSRCFLFLVGRDLATTYGVEIREFCILKGFNPQGKRGKMSSGHLHHPPPKSLFVAILPEEGWFYHPIIALKLIFSPFDLLTVT